MKSRVLISPYAQSISIPKMEDIFEKAGASFETIFRRLEINEVIKYTKGVGIDVGCGLNKVHSSAIGIDFRLGKIDFGYSFGANIKCSQNKERLKLPWFSDESLDFVFSSHCLEHFTNLRKSLDEISRVLKVGGYLVLILPDMKYYPKKGDSHANPDHEWDCYPEVILKIIENRGDFEVIQIDTLHNKLKNIELTERDKRIADHYGHNCLNFSFEGVFQKKRGNRG